MPYASVLDMWLRCIRTAYAPAAVYERYIYNVEHTFPNRPPFPSNRQRASWRNVVMGFAMLGRLFWRVGIRGSYRRTFWRTALPLLRAGKIEALINVALVSHHLIEFTRQCERGVRESSVYAPGARDRVRCGRSTTRHTFCGGRTAHAHDRLGRIFSRVQRPRRRRVSRGHDAAARRSLPARPPHRSSRGAHRLRRDSRRRRLATTGRVSFTSALFWHRVCTTLPQSG